jgi:hypothetical protein
MLKSSRRVWMSLMALAIGVQTLTAQNGEQQEVLNLLKQDRAFHSVPPDLFDKLGWDLPDGGKLVKSLADAAPGGAFQPRKLESSPADQLGYKARWHEVRYKVYGLDWDIPGLHLIPNQPTPGLPTLVIINGGAANWYEFFVDPLNRPGLAQYLAQKIPILLVTIPGNYKHGGWTEKKYEDRIPGYLLDRDVSREETKIRNAVYTFRVVSDGVKKLIETVTTGPVVIIGHSTGGEIQYILKDSSLRSRLQGLSMGWGTGGPAGMSSMQEFRGSRNADSYRPVWEIRPRPASGYSGGYLGPLNPVWDPAQTRAQVAEHWMGLEERRRPQFKQPLQDMEHNSADNLRDHAATQIQQALKGNKLGVKPDEVIADLFSTMRSSVTGYRKMIWTTAQLDDGHWDPNPAKARELQVANEFRKNNPNTPIRVLVFDVPMTHYGHVEKPRQLAGGLIAALTWLMQP